MHNIESLFYTGRKTPWHGLGISIEKAPLSEDAIVLAGLDWNVIQEDVMCSSGVITGYKANIRDTDHQVLGLVSDRYQIVQNKEAFAFTDALLGEGVRYETAGSLASGKRVWMLARMDTVTITDEKFDPYLVFTNAHDGKGSIRVAITPVRVVCQNTLNLALRKASRHWSCIHKGDIQGKLDEAKQTLLNAQNYMREIEVELGKLKLKKLTVDKVKEYVDLMFPIDENATFRTISRNRDMKYDLMSRYLDAPDLKVLDHSYYRFVNAVSDFATHTNLHKNTSNYQENLFMKTIDGNALIDMAYQIAVAA